MKINMWKLLFAALIASTAMVACKDERNNYMVDDTISFLATDNQLINVALYNEECDLTVIKSGKGQTGATARLEVSGSCARSVQYGQRHGLQGPAGKLRDILSGDQVLRKGYPQDG